MQFPGLPTAVVLGAITGAATATVLQSDTEIEFVQLSLVTVDPIDVGTNKFCFAFPMPGFVSIKKITAGPSVAMFFAETFDHNTNPSSPAPQNVGGTNDPECDDTFSDPITGETSTAQPDPVHDAAACGVTQCNGPTQRSYTLGGNAGDAELIQEVELKILPTGTPCTAGGPTLTGQSVFTTGQATGTIEDAKATACDTAVATMTSSVTGMQCPAGGLTKGAQCKLVGTKIIPHASATAGDGIALFVIDSTFSPSGAFVETGNDVFGW